MRHAVSDHGRLAAQQLLLDGLESGARIRAEPVAQLTAVRLVPHQRGGRARRRRLAAQQLGEHLLVARMLRGGHGQRPGRLRVPPQPGEGERPSAEERAVDGGALGAQHGYGVVGVAGLVGGTLPQCEPGLGRSQRPRVVPGPGPVRARGGVQQQGGAVDLILGEREPVSGRRAREDVEAQLRPGPGDEDLQRLSRPLRQLARPQPCDQPLGAAARAQVARQQREEGAEPGRGDLLSAVGDTRQQGQVGGHPCRLAEAPAAGSPGAGPNSRRPHGCRGRADGARTRATGAAQGRPIADSAGVGCGGSGGGVRRERRGTGGR